MKNRGTIETAAFSAMQKQKVADFDLLIAYKYNDASSLEAARTSMLDALDTVNAALLAVKTSDAGGDA